MKLEGSPAPSSSSNHVVLERLNNGKADRHKLDSAELPRIGEEDIHNVIGSLGYLSDSLHQQERREESGPGKQSWLMSENNSGQFPSHAQITAHRTHAFTTGQSYSSPGNSGDTQGLSPMFGYSNSPHSYSDGHSIQSPTGNVPPIPSLFPSNMSLPPDDPYSYHQTGGFPPYQTSLKRPKKKARSPKIGPDGVPCKRKSREGTTTYLWEFLLKLLQVGTMNKNILSPHENTAGQGLLS